MKKLTWYEITFDNENIIYIESYNPEKAKKSALMIFQDWTIKDIKPEIPNGMLIKIED